MMLHREVIAAEEELKRKFPIMFNKFNETTAQLFGLGKVLLNKRLKNYQDVALTSQYSVVCMGNGWTNF